jgi:MFS family permease
VACLVFCLIMVPAGRMQDRLGPRLVATIGGLLVGAGMILASYMITPMGFILGFGVLAGAGIGFGYASATPPAVKWFPPARTGLIAGIVVSGFGLASVYAAPLAKYLIGRYEVAGTMRILGIAFVVVVVGLAQLLRAPHKVMQFVKGLGKAGEMKTAEAAPVKKEDFTPREMLRTWQFWVLWFMYACGAGAGLMVISVARKLGAGKSIGALEAGTIIVVTLAIGNGAGRIIAGMLSDHLGRRVTMAIFFVFQAAMVMMLALSGTVPALGAGLTLAIVAALVGANYGSNLALFPSATKDYYGLKNFGVNYGLVFTAWGVGGFMLAKFAGWVYDGKIVEAWKGSFNFAYYTSAALLVLAAVLTFVVKAPHHHVEPVVEAAPAKEEELELVEV